MPDPSSQTTKLLSAHSLQVYGVFDGHNGSGVVEYTVTNLIQRITDELIKQSSATPDISSTTMGLLLRNVFLAFDGELYTNVFEASEQPSGAERDSGCTATIAVVAPSYILVAYIGDSPCILFDTKGTLRQGIGKHLPIPGSAEADRIVADNNGRIGIDKNGTPRVRGLMVSRAFGDFSIKLEGRDPPTKLEDWAKLGISPEPTITVWPRSTEPVILGVCSDGLIETTKENTLLSNEDLAASISKQMNTYSSIQDGAVACLNAHSEAMMKHLNQTSYTGDDLSIILVSIPALAQHYKKGGGLPKRMHRKTKARTKARTKGRAKGKTKRMRSRHV